MQDKDRRAQSGLKAIGVISDKLTKPLFGKRGLAEGDLIRHWSAIVGPRLAALSQPERVLFRKDRRDDGELTVRVSSGPAATLLQYEAPRIIERVNQFYNYPALSRLKLVQAPLPPRKVAKGPTLRPLSVGEEHDLEAAVAQVTDPDLREALLSLGRSLQQRKQQ